MIIGRDLVDYYYEDDERLYSTGDDYIDDLLEKAFCDGYEYAQYEFSDDDDDQNNDDQKKKKSGVGKKILKGVGITAGATLAAAGAYQGQHAIRKAIARNRYDKAVKDGVVGLPLANLLEKKNKLEQGNAFDKWGYNKVQGGIKNLFTRKKTQG